MCVYYSLQRYKKIMQNASILAKKMHKKSMNVVEIASLFGSNGIFGSLR
jgi:hypothetical protein